MAPDHLGLTGTQTSTPGGVRENPCDTSSLMRFLAQQRSSQAQQRLAHALKAKQKQQQQQQMWRSSKHRCFLSTLGRSPLSVQPASRPPDPFGPGRRRHLRKWFPTSHFLVKAKKEPDNCIFAHGEVSFLFLWEILDFNVS